jgi:hypothetical protein
MELNDKGEWVRAGIRHTYYWYGAGLPVYEYDLYFAESRTLYDTDYIRARDNRFAKRAIKRKHPNVIEFEFDARYAK